jgi:hypothetical protein
MLAAAFLGWAAPAAAQSERVDPHVLSIEIGRWGVMLSQIEDYRPWADRETETPVQERVRLAAELREQVWRYNAERTRICSEGAITSASCGASYLPAWLNEAPGAAPTLETLQSRSDEVAKRVGPLWDAACEQMHAHPDERMNAEEQPDICPME